VTKTPEVIVAGDVIDDVFVHTDTEIRPDTDTDADISLEPGGSAANTACWLSHLGRDVVFHGRVNARDLSRHADEFGRQKVTAVLQADPERHTGTIIVIVHRETRTMLTDRGANTALEVSSLCRTPGEIPQVLYLTGYSFFHRDSIDDLIELMVRVRQAGSQVVLDCSSAGFLADHGASWWWDIASHSSVVKANADEAKFLTGLDPATAAQAFAARGLWGIVTCGADGAAWCEPGGTPAHLPAHPLGAEGLVDPTGAGDSFSAGVISGMLQGLPARECVQRGLVVSAEAVSQRGARPLATRMRSVPSPA
jgi:sugar/nucleoside kinase (ribokinase family)